MVRWVPTDAAGHAVYRLGTAFEAVSTGEPATRVVVLQGETGSGRTGVLQAFYENVAGRQHGTPYWPPSLAATADPFTGRDVLVPDDFEVVAGTGLPWLWWGLSGREGCAALAANTQLQRHTTAFSAALADLGGDKRRRLAYSLDGLLLLGGLVGIVVPGVGTVATAIAAVRQVSHTSETFRTRRSRLQEALKTDSARRFCGREDAREAIVADAGVLAMLTGMVPLVVVIDHAEQLDSLTLGLMQRLVGSSQARVLVVLSVNTDHQPNAEGGNFEGRDGGGVLDVAEAFYLRGATEVVSLPAFTDQEMRTLCTAHLQAWSSKETAQPDSAPNAAVNARAVGAVLDAAGGAPGRLATLLSHRAVRAGITGKGDLPPDLTSMTTRASDQQVWQDLAVSARTALATMAVHGPTTLASLVDPDVLQDATMTGWVTTSTMIVDGAEADMECFRFYRHRFKLLSR